MKVRIKTFNGELPDYLTIKKIYIVGQFIENGCQMPYIIDDLDDKSFIDINRCTHLNGGSWEIVE